MLWGNWGRGDGCGCGCARARAHSERASGMLSRLGGKASLGCRTSISQHLGPLPFRIQAVFPSQQYSGQPIFPRSSSLPFTSLASPSPGSFFPPQRARASGRPRGHRGKAVEAESLDSHPWSCAGTVPGNALPLDSLWGSAQNECVKSFQVLGD